MIQKKICMIGSFAVGKTSLVRRFVESIFAEKYYTTVGVRIDKKAVQVDGGGWDLIIWDLAGEDEFLQIRPSYLRGSAGYLLVADGTRRATLDAAVDMQRRVQAAIGDVPFVLVLNKSDLAEEWEVPDTAFGELAIQGWAWRKASARSGVGVEDVFAMLVRRMQGA